QRQDHYQVFCDLVKQVSGLSLREDLVDVARDRFGSLDDVPDPLARMIYIPRWFREAVVEVAGLKDAKVQVTVGDVRGTLVRDLLKEASSHLEESRFVAAERACRSALEIDPKLALAWDLLGAVLRMSSRFEEAEEAYRKAIEIDPQFAAGWHLLGELLAEGLSRFEEAEQAYRKALEIDPRNAWAWADLGQLLDRRLSRFDEAEQAYRKAVELDPNDPMIRVRLLLFLPTQPDRREEAVGLARATVDDWPDDATVLSACACALWGLGGKPTLEQALRWAERAVESEPDDGGHRHTLAWIQCDLGRTEEALRTAEKYVADERAVRISVDAAVDLFVELAARGEAPRALQVLLDSPSRDQLEPLVVGIRIFLGEDVKVAAEIKEIGLDVARRIEQRRDALRSA
ncbi:MAG: tetratricopeptide repeat protein, partial [Planctomycetota bacterium]